jgi:hypothetical protein
MLRLIDGKSNISIMDQHWQAMREALLQKRPFTELQISSLTVKRGFIRHNW